MKVRRKSLWRRENVRRRFKLRANQRAAKERKRMERATRDEPLPDCSHVVIPKAARPLFVVTIKCSDGEKVALPIHVTSRGSLSVSPTLAGRKIAAILTYYRPTHFTHHV